MPFYSNGHEGSLRRAMRVLLLSGLILSHGHSTAQSAGFDPSSRRDDVVQARQLIMDALEEQVGPVDAASAGKVSNLEDLKSRAYLINTLLAAFPHLFPAGSMPADIPEDGTQTSATPAVWDKFDAFYDLSRTAASAAYDASQAKDEASFRTHAAALRKACDACHAQFMAAPASPEPPPK